MAESRGAITDVAGVRVGHLTLDKGAVQTGVTAVLPYPLSVGERKLFLGAFAASAFHEWTGRHVAQDFGTFSSPIVLCNTTAIGVAYDALISHSHRRAAELLADNAWPPVVIGLDDGWLNDLRERPVDHDAVLATVEEAGEDVACGSVGIGRGLCALGGKGGVGTASKALAGGGPGHRVGALIAANGGGERPTSVAPGFVLLLATDLPLLPGELRLLAEAGLRGLDGVMPFTGRDAQLALAWSTGNPLDGASRGFRLFRARVPKEERLRQALEAAAASSRAALRSALENATPVSGRNGRKVTPLSPRRIGRLFRG